MNTNNIKKITLLSLLAVAVVMVFTVHSISAATFTQLTGQVALGATGTDVTNLQTFLASNTTIYPEGRVTGLFGPLTQAAVRRFQTAFGISPVGAVGPVTLAKINSLIASGANLTGANGGGTTGDINAPTIFNTPTVSVSSTGATVSWGTNELARGEVYYSATPFQLAEAPVGVAEPTITGGTDTGETSLAQYSQNVSIQNLQPHTLYYFMVEATDNAGNLTYTLPATFVTNF